MSKQTYSATEIAAYFIHRAHCDLIDEGLSEGITNLKLQKVLYFAQAASLVLRGSPLFDEEIEAWAYGPVVPNVYHQYKEHKNYPIPREGVPYPDSIKTDEETETLVEGIWDLLSKYSAYELIEITHNHDPWKAAYKAGANNVIPKLSLRDYYEGIFRYQDGEEESE